MIVWPVDKKIPGVPLVSEHGPIYIYIFKWKIFT